MNKKISILLIGVFVLAACGSGVDESTATTSQGAEPATQTTEAAGSTAAVDSQPEATTVTSSDESQSDQGSGVTGEAAPDFTLALGDGSTFTLSETDKPVYLVFWAEW